MSLKTSKCGIAKEDIQFSGDKVNRGQCLSDKITEIRDAPAPKTKKEVRSLLGLAGYYRRFVSNFPVIALNYTVAKNIILKAVKKKVFVIGLNYSTIGLVL